MMKCANCGQSKNIDEYIIHYGYEIDSSERGNVVKTRYRILGAESVPFCRQCIIGEYEWGQPRLGPFEKVLRLGIPFLLFGALIAVIGSVSMVIFSEYNMVLLEAIGGWILGGGVLGAAIGICIVLLGKITLFGASMVLPYADLPRPYSQEDTDGKAGELIGYKKALSLRKEYIAEKCRKDGTLKGMKSLVYWNEETFKWLEVESGNI